ncbi:hypothetical protein CAMGR0001_1060 [Campylobacter gracilis RM3268]|uniref:Uncharacterized protein n=1 Tax=Campylobacter gracilis RM3268 TaxID=553220 RepID=C8PGR5_9BACT|nr:hypothetical protein CAMGR0001_1060 [Campylobacter gracilis RM3268]
MLNLPLKFYSVLAKFTDIFLISAAFYAPRRRKRKSGF